MSVYRANKWLSRLGVLIACLVTMSMSSAGAQDTLETLGVVPKGKGSVRASGAKQPSPAYSQLSRQWIVRSVQRDGKPNAAQIGQKVGDVITIKKQLDRFALG